jgi:uncharacterized protein (TIGR00661 family)
MANILYGVAGEGSGHSSRAKEIIRFMQGEGHAVKVVSYDKGLKNLSPHFDVEKIFGLHFSYKNNRVQYIPTVLKNLNHLPNAIKSINKVSKLVDTFKADIVFSDFEPISGLVANKKKLPLISIDNQHRLTNTKMEYPKKYKTDAVAAKTVTRLMLHSTKACLVISFYETEVTNKKTLLFPPILRDEVLNAKVTERDFILVYVTNPFKGLIDILKTINKKFVVYGYNRDGREKNLTFKMPSHDGFLSDLAKSEGVIANAGFTLITESLHLQKPYLALPVAGQFEQVLNAYYLEKIGYGKYWDELNKERIESFLYNIDTYKKRLKKYKREDNTKIFKAVKKLINQYS